ncbi:MAG: tRNA 5-methoxyuridine(34)/uridine 5-oxyacetic acid(34) synthase CmoB, partial [Lentisphaeraceae bacterium]|nr:tRNA 5-methoxyuridine(34)/uridine 5-oxyacetic acid(34) synthase CmoB [Lentisphaeraceae bacterium]
MQDYFDIYKDDIDLEALKPIRQQAVDKAWAEGMQQAQDAYTAMPKMHFPETIFNEAAVKFGTADSLSPEEQADLKEKLLALEPWRKGPFEIAGIDLDAEWRSDWKWERVLPALDSLKDRRICDIGANSGYYMYRMLEQNPEFVLGMDPTVKFYFQFLALQKMTMENPLWYEPFGMEEMVHYPKFFDTVFCMGILYHHKDPVSILRMIHDSMRKGGQLIVECQGIPGEGPYALFPEKTYAKVKGTYFVPTAEFMVNWLKKAWFTDIEVFHVSKMSTEEQRPTEFMVRQSYK